MVSLDTIAAVAVALARELSEKTADRLMTVGTEGISRSPWKYAGIQDLHRSRSLRPGFYVKGI